MYEEEAGKRTDMKKNIVKIGKMVYTSMCGCLSKRYRRRHMLTLENLSFGVQDEKSQKEIIRNLNLTIESNNLSSSQVPTEAGNRLWRS